MTHDPELTAAAYLAGELPDRDRQSFEDHLLECDECWAEVDDGRRGLAATESVRELAPPHLRSAIRRRIGAARPEGPQHPRTALYAAAGLALLAAITTAALVAWPSSGNGAIAAAVDAFTDDRLPGSAMPKAPAPDLTGIQMTQVGGGAGHVDEMPVTAYAYRDTEGRRLMVYIGTSTFPMPPRAQLFDGPRGPWMAHRDGIAVMCARHPHELLILGEDDELVHDAAVALDVM